MATYYAWSNFPVEKNEWGQVTKTIEVGEKVTASDLGVTDEEFEEMIETGVVSEEEYPDIPDSVSPAEYEKEQLARSAVVEELRMHVEEGQSIEEGLDEAAAKRAGARKAAEAVVDPNKLGTSAVDDPTKGQGQAQSQSKAAQSK